MKFSTQVVGKATGPTFTTVLEAVIAKIQTSYKYPGDIAKSLQDLAYVNIAVLEPIMSVSTDTDLAKKARFDKAYEIKYADDLRQWNERMRQFTDNKLAAFSLIFRTYCTKQLQTKIEQHLEFTTKIHNDPVELLKTIKQFSRDPVRAQYPYHHAMMGFIRLFEYKQYNKDSGSMELTEFYKGFKQLADNLKTILGDDWLKPFVQNTAEYKAADSATKTVLEKNGFDTLMTYIML